MPLQLLACCLRCTDAFTELKRGNMCSQREVGNSNIQVIETSKWMPLTFLGFSSLFKSMIFISICIITIKDLFLPISGIFIAGWKEKKSDSYPNLSLICPLPSFGPRHCGISFNSQHMVGKNALMTASDSVFLFTQSSFIPSPANTIPEFICLYFFAL